MRSIVTRNPLVSFFVLAFALSWWAVPLGGFLPFGPLLAALIVIGASTAGRPARAGTPHASPAGDRALVRRGRRDPARRRSDRDRRHARRGCTPRPLRELGPWYLVLTFGVLRLIDPLDGPLGEEPGWRGFALPRLLADRSPIRASVILGAIVALWHAPLVFLPAEHMPALFLVATVAVTFVYTWLYLRTDGNVFTTILAHSAEGTIKLGALGFAGVASNRLTVAYTSRGRGRRRVGPHRPGKVRATRSAPSSSPLRRAAVATAAV